MIPGSPGQPTAGRPGAVRLPGYVFDASCVPQPLVLRITSLDASGTPHVLVQWEDTNADGLPSVGDMIRTGDFPIFTSSTTWDFVPASQAEHVVTAITSLYRYAGPIPQLMNDFGITAWSGSQFGFSFAQRYGSYEGFDEVYLAGGTVYRSGAWERGPADRRQRPSPPARTPA